MGYRNSSNGQGSCAVVGGKPYGRGGVVLIRPHGALTPEEIEVHDKKARMWERRIPYTLAKMALENDRDGALPEGQRLIRECGPEYGEAAVQQIVQDFFHASYVVWPSGNARMKENLAKKKKALKAKR